MHDLFNVLVVSGGGFQGLSIIKGLKRSPRVRIILADCAEENICKYMVDSFHLVPKINSPEQFIRSLLEICKKENAGIIFPSTELELCTLAGNIELFRENDICVAVSDFALLNILRNKLSLHEFLKKNGFPILPLLDISAEGLKYPVLGKTLYGWGGRGSVILRSLQERDKYELAKLKSDYVWQPFLEGFDEYSIDCAINFDGAVSDFAIRKRIKTLSGFAVVSGSVDDTAVEKLINNFLTVISGQGACGIFNIQVLKTGNDYFFSDVNPRIGTSAVFSYEWGINLPLFLCAYIKPEIYSPLPSENFNNKNLKMVRYLEELWLEERKYDNIKGIVFDLDDTLINQKTWIFDKLEILWDKFKDRLPERTEFLLRAIQIVEEGNRSNLFDALGEEFQFSEELRQQLINTYRAIAPPRLPLFPEVVSTLTELKTKGFKLALLTDNPPASQKQKVKVGNLNGLFDTIVYSRELKNEKPSIIAFEKISRNLNIPVQSLIMVGDNLYKDIKGSLEADYNFAYWITREGTFFNFDRKLFDTFHEKEPKLKKISTLRELLYDLV